MKIAVFTDIHGNYQALSSILKDIKKRDVDKIICLGDNIGIGPSSNECLSLINKSNITVIAGNHELYYTKGLDKLNIENINELKHNEWIHSIISEEVNDELLEYKIEYNNKKILFIHFFLKNDKYPFESAHIFDDDTYKKVLKRFDYDAVFYGHIHNERTDIINNNVYYGLSSSGCVKDDNTFYYIVNIDDDIKVNKEIIKYDRKKFEHVLKNTKFPDKGHICDMFFGLKK